MIAQAAQDWLTGDETSDTPPERRVRYVFDEGHHLFDAADSGFAAFVSGAEMAELRRWIRAPRGARAAAPAVSKNGSRIWWPKTNRASCARGGGRGRRCAGRRRLDEPGDSGQPRGAGEVFLAAAYAHVSAQSDERESFYSREAGTEPLARIDRSGNPARGPAAPPGRAADAAGAKLRKQLDDEAEDLETYRAPASRRRRAAWSGAPS